MLFALSIVFLQFFVLILVIRTVLCFRCVFGGHPGVLGVSAAYLRDATVSLRGNQSVFLGTQACFRRVRRVFGAHPQRILGAGGRGGICSMSGECPQHVSMGFACFRDLLSVFPLTVPTVCFRRSSQCV